MTRVLTGAVAALFVLASHAGADEPPTAPPLPAEVAAHHAMQEAMLRHAAPPREAPAMPEQARTQERLRNESHPHHQAAEQMAQRHAVIDRERRRDGAGDPAGRGHGGAAGGTATGGGGGHGGLDSPGGPAEHIQTMGGHGGPGGMEGGDHAGSGEGTGPLPGAGPQDGATPIPGTGPGDATPSIPGAGPAPHDGDSGQIGGMR